MQNMLPDEYQHQLDAVREDLAHCIARFHAVQVLDQNRFSSLQGKLDTLVAMSKGRWLLPKDLLKDLYFFQGSLENIKYAVNPELQLEWSKYFSKVFLALLNDESLDERVPGVPRII